MNFSFAGLFGGFAFGVLGMLIFRLGIKKASYTAVGIGSALMIFPLFVYNVWLLWALGSALCYLGYQSLKTQ